jgi:hypothetical protein
MNIETTKTTLSDKVVGEIKDGQVKMKPRFYFIFKAVSFDVTLLFAFLATVFLISFIIFVVHGNGTWFLFGFGWPGIKMFLTSFPWLLATIALVLLVLMEILVHRLGFAYRRPLIFSMLGVLGAGLAAGIFVATTPLHEGAFQSAQESTLPVAGALYRNYGVMPTENLYSGVVSEPIDENDFSIDTPEEQNVKIQMSTSTSFGQDVVKENVEKNDPVMIMGEKKGSEIKAFGVHKFEKNQEPLFQRWQNNAQMRMQKNTQQETKNKQLDTKNEQLDTKNTQQDRKNTQEDQSNKSR